jgi:hypothetical protein
MRGLKRKRTPVIAGYQIYHNYIRPHEALDEKTQQKQRALKLKATING